ncbi:MAG: RNA pyrophosphohydrolase [Paracoccaceae bacterium]|nr:RNA pyrophosphohydrolase [Paracoccaceae bacterium]|tara:strand:+ start:2553 stop:3059 length:507 start_codon:yes stop_codon:yes gene_type:complete
MASDAHDALPYRLNVGIMLINHDGLVFVGQRRDNHSDAWQMPQGGIDDGENPKEAALRELHEETGIPANLVQVLEVSENWISYDLPKDLISQLWGGRFRGQKQKWYLMRFLGSDTEVNIQTETPEFSAWKWIPPDALVENIVPFKKSVYQKVLSEFSKTLLMPGQQVP